MVFYEQMTAQYIHFWQKYHVAVKSDVIQRLCSASFLKKNVNDFCFIYPMTY